MSLSFYLVREEGQGGEKKILGEGFNLHQGISGVRGRRRKETDR